MIFQRNEDNRNLTIIDDNICNLVFVDLIFESGHFPNWILNLTFINCQLEIHLYKIIITTQIIFISF
jgi:hypothetical protein